MKIKAIISILAVCSLTSVTEAREASSYTVETGIKSLRPTNDFVHFSFPINADTQLQPIHQTSTTSSDEYWFQVSGKELNKGLTINTTQVGSLIRITQGHAGKGLNLAPELDTTLLKLFSKQAPKQSAIGQLVSKNQLAETGVFDNTVAIKTAANVAVGALVLKTSQALSAEDTYTISVKEKGSPYRLRLNLEAQSYGENEKVAAFAHLLNRNKTLVPKSLNFTLIAPDGQSSAIDFFTNKQGGVELNLIQPKNAITPINGLYEIMLEATGEVNGLTVQRNAKLALAFTKNTARFAKVTLDPQAADAKLGIFVSQEGRYEVRGILYATNYQGDLVPVMETHAAQTLKPGLNTLRLPFNQKILNQSQASAPFELRNVRLFDQSQLGLVDTLRKDIVAY